MLPSIWVVSFTTFATECSTRLRPSRVAMWVAPAISWTHMRYRPEGRRRSWPRRRRERDLREGSSEGSGAEATTGPSSSVRRVTGPWDSPPPRPRFPLPRPPRRPRLRPARSWDGADPLSVPDDEDLVSPILGPGLVSP